MRQFFVNTRFFDIKYPELHRTYKELSDREKDVQENFGGTSSGTSLLTEINGVDFAKPIRKDSLPEDVPLKADSDAHRFGIFVWGMLDACESGSVGGDACRMSNVLAAAVDDVRAFASKGDLFHHLLGLVLAIRNQGVQSWLERGDRSR